VCGSSAFQIGTLRMKSGACSVGGLSRPSNATCRPVGRGLARDSTSASRTPFHAAFPTAPFSHWMPEARGLWKEPTVAGAFEGHVLREHGKLLQIVQAEDEGVVHLALDFTDHCSGAIRAAS